MSALDDVIRYHADNCQSGTECDLSALSRAELAQLRDTVSGLADMAKQLGIEHTLVAQLRDDLQAANDELAAYSKLAVILNASSAAEVIGAVDALYTELRMSHERIAEQARQLAEQERPIGKAKYQLYYPTSRSQPHIIEVDDHGDRVRYVAEFYHEEDAKEFIDALNRAAHPAPQADEAQP